MIKLGTKEELKKRLEAGEVNCLGRSICLN